MESISIPRNVQDVRTHAVILFALPGVPCYRLSLLITIYMQKQNCSFISFGREYDPRLEKEQHKNSSDPMFLPV